MGLEVVAHTPTNTRTWSAADFQDYRTGRWEEYHEDGNWAPYLWMVRDALEFHSTAEELAAEVTRIGSEITAWQRYAANMFDARGVFYNLGSDFDSNPTFGRFRAYRSVLEQTLPQPALALLSESHQRKYEQLKQT